MTSNKNVSVSLTPKLWLKQALKKAGFADPSAVTRLTVAGLLTEKDFRHIRNKMAETLRELDMRDALIERCKIPDNAFFNCTGLTSVTIPDSVTVIGDDAFRDCTGLLSLKVPASVVKLGARVVSGCNRMTAIEVHPGNTVYASADGVLFAKDMTVLIYYPRGRKGDYIIPDSAAEIRQGAFYDCRGLSSVIIPDSVTKIGHHAFYGCTGLTSVVISDSVTEMETGAFSHCKNLKTITIPDSLTKIGAYPFFQWQHFNKDRKNK